VFWTRRGYDVVILENKLTFLGLKFKVRFATDVKHFWVLLDDQIRGNWTVHNKVLTDDNKFRIHEDILI
jgi:hypothetical protein